MMQLQRFRMALGDELCGCLVDSPAQLAHYAASEGHHAPSTPVLAARPRSVSDVQQLVRAAGKAGLSITPFGAGTSLEGNAAAGGSLCIDFSEMNAVVEVAAEDMLAVVQPGVTREQLNRELRHSGLFFPVDPGADASLGGMIATRASGTTTVRYGGMRENTLCLKVVTADGEVVTTGTRARKSAAGYDLTHLFAGSEGTLGLIVEATLRLHGLPERTMAATVPFPAIGPAVETVIATLQSAVPIARMELLDEVAIDACNRLSGLGLPVTPTLFLEFHGSPASVDEQYRTVAALAAEFGSGPIQAAVETEQRAALWKARHQALYAARALVPGAVSWVSDVCVPIGSLSEAIARARQAIDEAGLLAPILGHVGDGNFHVFFILLPGDADAWDKARAVNEAMIAHALSVGGTCTGEHGIGIGKRHALLREHGEESVALMRRIKRALDPQDLFNPGKIFLD
jgi:D-lactate dehydrogenase (cytochrome)